MPNKLTLSRHTHGHVARQSSLTKKSKQLFVPIKCPNHSDVKSFGWMKGYILQWMKKFIDILDIYATDGIYIVHTLVSYTHWRAYNYDTKYLPLSLFLVFVIFFLFLFFILPLILLSYLRSPSLSLLFFLICYNPSFFFFSFIFIYSSFSFLLLSFPFFHFHTR